MPSHTPCNLHTLMKMLNANRVMNTGRPLMSSFICIDFRFVSDKLGFSVGVTHKQNKTKLTPSTAETKLHNTISNHLLLSVS